MKKKSFLLMVAFVSIGLLGLIATQAYFLLESYKMKSELFDRSVNTALNNVVNKLEKVDAVHFIHNRIEAPRFPLLPKRKRKHTQKIELHLADEFDRNPDFKAMNPERVELLKIDTDRNSKMIIRYGDEHIESMPFVNHHMKGVKKKIAVFDTKVILAPKAKSDSSSNLFYYNEHPSDKRHKQFFEHIIVRKPNEDVLVESYLDSILAFKQRVQVFEKLAEEMQQKRLPLAERADPKILDSLLHKELANAGISLSYNFSIANNHDSVIFRKVNDKQNQTAKGQYKTALFPNEVMKESGFIMISFADKDEFLWKKMSFLIMSSGLIILFILSCFVLTIYSLFRQKKLTEMKSDFINNMTHEFKTPVATIMLASEALRDEDMANEQAMVKRYASIIYDENLRLSSYVERVLNVARLERSDLKLERKPIQMNDLVQAVVDSMALQFSKRKAKLTIQLHAEHVMILGDEMHLSNVIFNLLDNALKYSDKEPEISVTTFNHHQQLHLLVTDNGIGMSKDQQNRIFDQFYRAHTGNLHDVKGFGLGLHYVHSIIKLLGGSVKVKSELEKGSSFEVSLPFEKTIA